MSKKDKKPVYTIASNFEPSEEFIKFLDLANKIALNVQEREDLVDKIREIKLP